MMRYQLLNPSESAVSCDEIVLRSLHDGDSR
jgi:hypothetical protein